MEPLKQDDPRHIRAVADATHNRTGTGVAETLVAYYASLAEQNAVLVEAYRGDDR